ncbi:hypothetical protein K491DRAFT_61051 [Lophiostoma macrostomum CBS 122681]|uniref:Uncharacterized protein n=1 Tax=Lophiostoma macrostomum CBS 122681 TaxID=1314788 RepID=A0A6A6TL72_9PLEO|nr:hypothetical protein K491DRAFT_61051 [Lophiostoma macrostomum CBS 122681]
MASHSTPRRSKRNFLLRRLADLIDERLRSEETPESVAPGNLPGRHTLQDPRSRLERYRRTARNRNSRIERVQRPGISDDPYDPPPAYSLLEPPIYSTTTRQPSGLSLSDLDCSSTLGRQGSDSGSQVEHSGPAQDMYASARQHGDSGFHPESISTLRNQQAITTAGHAATRSNGYSSQDNDGNNRPKLKRNTHNLTATAESSRAGRNGRAVIRVTDTASPHSGSSDGSIDLHQAVPVHTSFLSSSNVTFSLSPFVHVSIFRTPAV